MELRIEKAEKSDLELIVQGQKKAFYECYQRYQDHEMSPYNVTLEMMNNILEHDFLYKIICDENIVGAIYVSENPDQYHMKLHGIFIEPEYQDKGIGQSAIEHIEKLHNEAISWVLETPHDLKRNHHLYEKFGYKRTGEEDYVNENLSIIHYKKDINNTRKCTII